MLTSKDLKLIIARNFPRVPEEERAKEKALAGLKAEPATARDIYVIVRLLEHHIVYQDALIAWLCGKLLANGVDLGQRAAPGGAPGSDAPPPADAADGGASWVMQGLNPDDKSPSPSERAAGGPPDGGASWVMQGIEGDGPAPSTNQPQTTPPPPAPPTNGGAAAPTPAVPTAQTLPNVQTSGAAVPPGIQAMFAQQAAEMNKPAGT